MRVLDYPVAPVVIGLILGPLAEQQLRRALAIGEGNPLVLINSPISICLLAVAVLIVVGPFLGRLATQKYVRTRGATSEQEATL